MSPMGWLSTGEMKVRIEVIGDGGVTHGVCKMGKMGQKAKYRKIGENGQRVMNRNEKSPNFLIGINAFILSPPQYVRKKWKKCQGIAKYSIKKSKYGKTVIFVQLLILYLGYSMVHQIKKRKKRS